MILMKRLHQILKNKYLSTSAIVFLLLIFPAIVKAQESADPLNNKTLDTGNLYDNWLIYIVYVLSLGIFIFFIRRYELNRINLRNQLKIEKVSTDSLRQIDQMKSNFFANISHEFRTPLTLILGQIESVISSGIDNRENAKLLLAQRNARRLLTLINQLLDLSKLEAGNMELNVSKYNIVSFLKNLLYSFEAMAAYKKIDLSFESDSDYIPVMFDLDKMEKVFFNLVSNAIKYTGENGKVSVSVVVVESKDVLIKVEDTGTGIPEKYIPYIFNRFYQVESSSTRNYEGTGIGLALVKELIDLHKGSVTVNSREGVGTEFQVRLTLCAEIAVAVNDENAVIDKNQVSVYYHEKGEIEEINGHDKLLKPENTNSEIVLVVEDNKDVRAYIREQLEEFYIVKEAENGEVGIKLAFETVPDLIISDLMMPKVDGFEFCKTVRNDERTSHIPIVVLTAKAGFDDKIEGLEIGVDDYLTKPFSAKELRVRVRNLISQRKLLRSRFKTATVIKPSEVTAKSIDQVFLDKVIKTIEANFENQNFIPESLAETVNMSVSQLNRKLNAMIEQPAGQLMRSLRLQRAADLLKQKAGTVSEICYQLDFNDPAYFSRAFKKQFGCSPSEFVKN
jgi:signal transduction histidine kinase/CheY-like chemotaxis protein